MLVIRPATAGAKWPTCRPLETRETVPLKTLILGLGNSIVTDDSVGLRVAEVLRPLLADRTDIEVSEDYWGGLRLMERMIGFDRAIVVNAIQTGAPPGTIHRLTPDGLPTQHSASAHNVEPVDRPGVRPPGRHAPARKPSYSACRNRGRRYTFFRRAVYARGPGGRSTCGRGRAEGPVARQ